MSTCSPTWRHISAAARYAAAATDIGAAGAQQAAHIAALQAGQSYRRVIDAAMSFADEEDGLLHYRRAWSAERLAGGPQAHRDALAAQLAKSRQAFGNGAPIQLEICDPAALEPDVVADPTAS